jgi:hypothetical protein
VSAETLPLGVGVRFAHAALQVLAEDHGIDLLHIKGPAVDSVLLDTRQVEDPESGGTVTEPVPRRSVDADVLVRPSQVDSLIERMHEHGWTTLYRFEDGSPFEHATTMSHPFLSMVDVHRRFPGLGGDPEAAFDRLWAERGSTSIAGRPCAVPSLPGQRLVLILHATRAGALQHSDIRRTWTDATDEERGAVRELAESIGAGVALAAGTGRLHEYVGDPQYELWRALAAGERAAPKVWWARVRAAPTKRAALRTAVRLIVPNPNRMEVGLGRRPTARELGRAYVSRARWGASELRVLLRDRPGRRR